MIVYLTDAKHTSTLDFLDVPIKRMTGTFTLRNFVMYDLRNLNHCTDIVLQHLACDDTDSDFLQALTELKALSDIRVTLIDENLSETSEFFAKLTGIGITNIVTADDVDKQRGQIVKALSEEQSSGTGKLQFNASNVAIFVCGSQPRIGCTTAALGLSFWLQTKGARVNYIQANGTEHLESIAEAYELERKDDFWVLEKCVLSDARITSKKFNFLVYDIGTRLDAAQMQSASCILAVIGTKPYEITASSVLATYFDATKITLICNFTSPELQEDYREAFQNEEHNVAFLDCQTDIMNTDANKTLWRKIINEYVK